MHHRTEIIAHLPFESAILDQCYDHTADEGASVTQQRDDMSQEKSTLPGEDATQLSSEFQDGELDLSIVQYVYKFYYNHQVMEIGSNHLKRMVN